MYKRLAIICLAFFALVGAAQAVQVGGAGHSNGPATINFAASTITSGGGTATIDWSVKPYAIHDLTENVTYTFTAPVANSKLTLKIIQDAAARTITWPGTVVWPDGTAPTLSATEDDVDIIIFYYDGTSYYGVFSQDFSYNFVVMDRLAA